MKRTIVFLLAAALLLALAPLAQGNPRARASGYRGLDVGWWRHDGKTGTLYFFGAYSISRYDRGEVDKTRAYLVEIPCMVDRRGRPNDCEFRHVKEQRVKVDVFEIDPLLNSAHVVVHKGSKRGELDLTGFGDYYPFAWQTLNEFLLPPYLLHYSAGVSGYLYREAKATGDLFGLRFKRSERLGASLGTSAGASSSAWIWP